MKTSVWNPVEPSLFFSKGDPQDPRMGNYAKAAKDFAEADLCLWGYPDDEGIALNGGRIGAKDAPDTIRKYLYKMTPHLLKQLATTGELRIADLGNLTTTMTLEERHQLGREQAEQVTDKNIPWVSLGGGHDYGYADGAGFLRSALKSGKKPIVVNLDAHLDVRPTDQGLNSGTPFYRLLQEFPGAFSFYEIGLQPQCNSQSHWDWAQTQGAHLISAHEARDRGLLSIAHEICHKHAQQPLWISLDIDAIRSSEAPGCSQSWATGLSASEIFPFLSELYVGMDWKSFSIYEVSPSLDLDNHTSKLAALFIHHFIFLGLLDRQPWFLSFING